MLNVLLGRFTCRQVAGEVVGAFRVRARTYATPPIALNAGAIEVIAATVGIQFQVPSAIAVAAGAFNGVPPVRIGLLCQAFCRAWVVNIKVCFRRHVRLLLFNTYSCSVSEAISIWMDATVASRCKIADMTALSCCSAVKSETRKRIEMSLRAAACSSLKH
jgi:hypothetical protein